MKTAPVILFVYNRPEHTRKVLEALAENDLAPHAEVFIFSDGPKENADELTIEKIKKVRDVIRGNYNFKSTVVIESRINKGLALSVMEGVSQIIETYERVIVLEDDLVTSPYFLNFMNDALVKYHDNEKAACITGYVYPVSGKLPDTFFLKGADCWGWATWKRAWKILEKDGQKLLNELEAKKLTKVFDFDNSYPYTEMLREQISGKNNSWAILWYASAFLNNMYCLYPGKSLVKNIGIDGSGTHSGISGNWNVTLAEKKINLIQIPVVEDAGARAEFVAYFRKINGNNSTIVSRIYKKVKSWVPDSVKKNIKKMVNPSPKFGWFGNYSSWEEAKIVCTGYDAQLILEKVRNSVLKVKNGEAVYERDSVLFDEIQLNQDLLEALISIAAEHGNKLHVTDFGGSLGSTYFQNRNFLTQIKELKWAVVEQKHFVDCGRAEIETGALKFYHSIGESLEVQQPHVLLLSSVIPYFEKPYELIAKCIDYNFDYIIVDRTAFLESENDRITIQKVPEEIYKASYPAWFFNEHRFVTAFSGNYELKVQFDCKFDSKEPLEDGVMAYRKGFVFKRIK